MVEQLDMFFIGKTVQERIRECLEFGINTNKEIPEKLLSEPEGTVEDEDVLEGVFAND